jgi:hypothetical protein
MGRFVSVSPADKISWSGFGIPEAFLFGMDKRDLNRR